MITAAIQLITSVVQNTDACKVNKELSNVMKPVAPTSPVRPDAPVAPTSPFSPATPDAPVIPFRPGVPVMHND